MQHEVLPFHQPRLESGAVQVHSGLVWGSAVHEDAQARVLPHAVGPAFAGEIHAVEERFRFEQR
jgi:hypothetical protein